MRELTVEWGLTHAAVFMVLKGVLNFRQRASFIYDRRFTNLQRTLFIYLINKYISLSDICLTVHH